MRDVKSGPQMLEELKKAAFECDGECGWSREQEPQVVAALREARLAILGGELWWVKPGVAVPQLIPLRSGERGVYVWETERLSGQSWDDFVDRCASDTLAAIERWPTADELLANFDGRILCNLTWITEPPSDKSTTPS